MDLELLSRLAVALGIGLLIGIERGWATRGEAAGQRTAGLRTFSISGLLGGVSAALAVKVPDGGVVLAVIFAGFAGAFTLFRYREVSHDGDFGMTTLVAGLLTFALGALSVAGEPVIASAAGVATAGLLSLKQALHGWLRDLTWEELRSGLVLLAMSVILLPVLPNRDMGPWGALNPYELWQMTVLIAAVSSAGYIAMKWAGGTHGIALSALAGGLVSSTATTLSFSRLAKETPAQEAPLMAGAILAGATMMGRILLVTAAVSPAVLRWLVLPLTAAGIATAALAGYWFWRHRAPSDGQELEVKSPFDLATVLKFGFFLAFVMLAAKGLVSWAGDGGAYLLAAVSGIADVDAITLSMSRLATQGMSADTAATAILIAAAVNTVAKTGLAWTAGGRGPGMRLAAGAGVAILAGTAGYLAAHVVGPLQWLQGMEATPA